MGVLFSSIYQMVQDTNLLYFRGVVPGGAGGAMTPPDFGRSVNPISTKGGRFCPPNNTGTPGFSDLPTALHCNKAGKLELWRAGKNLNGFDKSFKLSHEI